MSNGKWEIVIEQIQVKEWVNDPPPKKRFRLFRKKETQQQSAKKGNLVLRDRTVVRLLDPNGNSLPFPGTYDTSGLVTEFSGPRQAYIGMFRNQHMLPEDIEDPVIRDAYPGEFAPYAVLRAAMSIESAALQEEAPDEDQENIAEILEVHQSNQQSDDETLIVDIVNGNVGLEQPETDDSSDSILDGLLGNDSMNDTQQEPPEGDDNL
jgi:hypothetical protein